MPQRLPQLLRLRGELNLVLSRNEVGKVPAWNLASRPTSRACTRPRFQRPGRPTSRRRPHIPRRGDASVRAPQARQSLAKFGEEKSTVLTCGSCIVFSPILRGAAEVKKEASEEECLIASCSCGYRHKRHKPAQCDFCAERFTAQTAQKALALCRCVPLVPGQGRTFPSWISVFSFLGGPIRSHQVGGEIRLAKRADPKLRFFGGFFSSAMLRSSRRSHGRFADGALACGRSLRPCFSRPTRAYGREQLLCF